MEDCCNCVSLKKQLEDLKQKHVLDFRTIKQKIISTDTLIRSYQEKCNEYDKQKKCILELTSKLDGAQRSVEVFKLQLKKSLELKEPLQKKCNELERERVLHSGEIQTLQDRLRGSENLIGQLQTVIKESETSTESMRIDVSLHTVTIEEYKKSQKKNEVQINKITEKLLTEKKANKELNKDLTKSENKVKSLLNEAEESRRLIADLRRQLKAGKNEFSSQPTPTSLEKQLKTMKNEAEEYKKRIAELNEEIRKVKLREPDENKVHTENKIKSPTTPKRSARARKSITPKKEEVLAVTEQIRPFTRLQQKNFVEKIEKNSLQFQVKSDRGNFSGQQENFSSESGSDIEPTRTLMDKVNEMLDIPLCPILSPLPPSPFVDDDSVSGSSVGGFGNNDPDYIFDDDVDNNGGINCIDALNDNHDIGGNINKDDPDNIYHHISNDDPDNVGVNCGKSNTNSINGSGSIIERNSTAYVDGTFSSACKDKISSNGKNTDDESALQAKNIEQSRGEKKDLRESTVPKYGGTLMTLRSRKKRRGGNLSMECFRQEARKDEQSESKPERILRRSKSLNLSQELRTPPSDINVRVTRSKSHEKKECSEGILEVRPRRRRKRKISSNDGDYDESLESSDTSIVGNIALDTSKQSGGDSGESHNNGETSDTFKETPKRPRTRPMGDIHLQNVVAKTKDPENTKSSGANIPETDKDVLIVTSIHEPPSQCQDTLMESADMQLSRENFAIKTADNMSAAGSKPSETDDNEVLTCLQNIVEVVANENTETFMSGKVSNMTKAFVETEHCRNSQNPQIEMEVMDCLDAVLDAVINSDNDAKSSTLRQEIDCGKPLWKSTNNCYSKVVEEKNESSPIIEYKGNDLNDNYVKSDKCEISSMKSNSVHNDTETSDLKRTDKTKLQDLDSSAIQKPLDGTLTRNKLVTRKAHERKTTPVVHDRSIESCDNTVDLDEETTTAKTKQNLETFDSSCGNNKEINAVNGATSKDSDDTAITSKPCKKKVTRAGKQKTRNSSGGNSTKKSETMSSNDVTKSSLDDKSEFLNPTYHDTVINTRQTRVKVSKESDDSSCERATSNTLVETTFSETPTTADGRISTISSPEDSWEEQFGKMSAPLSPIPDTPRRRGRTPEIPSFESLDLPLSPIPPSPPHSPRADEVEHAEVADQLPKSPKESKVGKKPKTNTVELPSNPLNRYPVIKEPKYVVFMFRKLMNNEITTAELIRAFSVRKNVRNHTPIVMGLLEVLRTTQDDLEHALMEQCAEQCERVSGIEDTGEPIVSEFEMKVVIAVYQLCNNQRLSNLLNKLVNSLEKQIPELFKSGEYDAGLLAMCRIYTAVCRLMGEGSFVRMLCYDIVKQNQRHSITERVILSIAFVWSGVLGKGSHLLSILPEAVAVSGPPYHSFLATLQVLLMSREISELTMTRTFQYLCGWCDTPRDNTVLEWLARDLVRVLRLTCEEKPQDIPDCSPTLNSVAFETIKSLELLSLILGWKWTNDVLIREILWPLLKEWKLQELGKKKETVTSNTIKSDDVFDLKESRKISADVLIGDLNTKETQYCAKAESVTAVELSCPSNTINQVGLQSVKNDELAGTSEMELSSEVLKGTVVDSRTESDGINHKHSMDGIIVNILRLLGYLGCERLRKGEVINLDAVLNLLYAIVTCSNLEKVTFGVQHAAAHALVDIIMADPIKITGVLDDWCTKSSKIDNKLTAQFAKRVKEARAQMWTT